MLVVDDMLINAAHAHARRAGTRANSATRCAPCLFSRCFATPRACSNGLRADVLPDALASVLWVMTLPVQMMPVSPIHPASATMPCYYRLLMIKRLLFALPPVRNDTANHTFSHLRACAAYLFILAPYAPERSYRYLSTVLQ